VVKLPANVGVVSQQLAHTPVLQGTAVHDGWSRPDPLNGQISFDLPNPQAGHATCVVSVTPPVDGHHGLVFQNSWGEYGGRYGYGLLRDDQWDQCLMDDPVTCEPPEGWVFSANWKRFIITPAAAP
jgi:hypothetical protein